MNKKILAVLAASLLCVSMVACGGGEEKTPETTKATTAATTVATTQAPAPTVDGKWVGKTGTAQGVTLDFATIGMNMTIEFKAGGVVTITDDDGAADAKWEKTSNGAKIIDGDETIEVILKDGKLEMTQDEVVLTFEKAQ